VVNAYNILVRMSKGKSPLYIPRHRCKDGTKIDLKQTGWETVDWIHVSIWSSVGILCEHGNGLKIMSKAENILDF
jgi:hypothetical protein